jgi:hypothetical protein
MLHYKNQTVMKCHAGHQILMDTLELHRQWRIDMRFRTWNRSLYRSGSLETVASKLANYNLDLVAIQEVRWNEGGNQPADDYAFFFFEMGMVIIT